MVWEQRWHPLRAEWVMVAAHRQQRPWIGEEQPPGPPPALAYDPDCTFCPGNARISGERNPAYGGVFTFGNDRPCVAPDAPEPAPAPGCYRRQAARGISRVMCYTPRHDQSLADLTLEEVVSLLEAWQEQYRELAARPEIASVLTFENRGEIVGVSNPHPHCQVYAASFVFRNFEVEARASRQHHQDTGRCLFQDILATEVDAAERLVAEGDSAVAFVPFFARYAYETYVTPRAFHPSIATLNAAERADLGAVLRTVLRKLDNLWQTPMPYIMALHQAPAGGAFDDCFQFHIQIHPPLRLPRVRKYLAGCEEGGGNFLSDTSPEAKAAELRQQSDRPLEQPGPDSG